MVHADIGLDTPSLVGGKLLSTRFHLIHPQFLTRNGPCIYVFICLYGQADRCVLDICSWSMWTESDIELWVTSDTDQVFRGPCVDYFEWPNLYDAIL